MDAITQELIEDGPAWWLIVSTDTNTVSAIREALEQEDCGLATIREILYQQEVARRLLRTNSRQ